MEPEKRPTVGFTPKEIQAFKLHAVLMAAVGASFTFILPPGPGRVLGALFAVALLPVPLIVYALRRRKERR